MNRYVSGAYNMCVLITGSSSKVLLTDIDILRDKRIKHIDFLTIAKTPDNGNAVTSANDLFITLREKNTQDELIKDLACKELTKYSNRLFINKIVDWARSYVDISGATGLTGKYLQLVIWYDYPVNRTLVPDVNRTEINNFEIKLKGSKTYFSEKPDIENCKFQNILISYPGLTPLGDDGLDQAYAGNKFVTFVHKGVDFFSRIPLFLFHQQYNDYQLKLQNIKIDLTSSYVETLTTTVNDLKSLFFNCIIDDNK